MAKQATLTKKPAILTNGKLLTDQPLLDRGMNLEECGAICTSPEIPVKGIATNSTYTHAKELAPH